MLIILVDDNSLIRTTIREFIEDKEDIIYEFSSGASVIQFLKEERFEPDWILLDIKMKSMNGFTTAKQIKLINSNWKIAFITNYDSHLYQKKAKEIGVNLLISKDNLSCLKEAIKS